MFSALTRRALVKPYHLLDVIKNKFYHLQYQIKCAKNIKYSKMPIFLTNITFVVFKHCLQMFMHIIAIKSGGPAAAGIIGALLYTGGEGGVQTDGAFEVPVLFKVAGHYRGGEGWSALYAKREGRQVGSLVLKTSWHQELRWNVWLHVWSAPRFWYKSAPGQEKKIL